jgi:hypothetical protein
MAVVFFGTLPWTEDQFDLNTPFRVNDGFELTTRSMFFPGSFSYTIDGTSVVLRLKSVLVTHTYNQVGDETGLAVMGRGLTTGADGRLSGGTIAVLSQVFGEPAAATHTLIGIDLPVADYRRAAATRDRADDAALIARLFSGDDLVGLSQTRDVFDAGGGRDLVFANSGNDVIRLGAGQDAAVGGNGRDKLFGGNDSDLLFGSEGTDTLDGGRGNDVLDGGRGNDLLKGGPGNDVFHFVTGDGRDTVTGFDPGSDLINIGAGARSFDELQLRDVREGTRVNFSDVSILLAGVERADLDAAEFRFVAGASLRALLRFDDIFDNFIRA